MDKLDKLIEEVKNSADFSAEVLNQLHGAISEHPWCKGKSFNQRKSEVLFAAYQTKCLDVPSAIVCKIERLSAP